MSQLCSSSDTCHLLYTLLVDCLLLFVTFLTSHPIHSAYFLFFSPYLLPLLSFLSPLILSTSILLLLLFLFLHSTHEANAASLLDQLGSTRVVALIGNVFEWEFETMHEVYNDAGMISFEGDPDNDPVDIFLDSSEKELSEETEVRSETDYCDRVEQVQEENLQGASSVPADSPSSRVGEERGGGGSRAKESLQRDGSMRKEKEWKRTLACKLYEERMTFKLCEDRTVVDGAEEMDLLWEAYEVDAKKQTHLEEEDVGHDDDDDEEEEEEEVNLCCLQALRLSTGKMNLGVRRPNLEKFSKAFKGFGFFRRSGRRSRKG